MPIHQEVTYPVAPERVYEVLTDGPKFMAATDRPAKIGDSAGAAFSLFGGNVEGRHIELVPGERVVQAWRFPAWDAGVYSIVRLSLNREGAGTRLVLDHDGVPEGPAPLYPSWHEHVATNWPVYYFEPIARYFAT
jgi:activator of HSP90 ATPase